LLEGCEYERFAQKKRKYAFNARARDEMKKRTSPHPHYKLIVRTEPGPLQGQVYRQRKTLVEELRTERPIDLASLTIGFRLLRQAARCCREAIGFLLAARRSFLDYLSVIRLKHVEYQLVMRIGDFILRCGFRN
jgi:hypothetical protein